MTTIDGKLAVADGRPSGFDYLRIGLSVLVIMIHGYDVTYGRADHLHHSLWRLVIEPVLPMFFALSGFLVAGSLMRCRSLVSFLGLRALRIYPALACETILSAALLGTLFTTLPLWDYLTSPVLARYLLNLTGSIQYVLPGVFTTNPWAHTVNAQLWTIPYELECYILLSIIALVGAHKNRWLLTAIVVAMQIAGLFHTALPSKIIDRQSILVLCFMYGVLLFVWRDRVPLNAGVFAATIVGAIGLLATPGYEFWCAPLLAYITVYLGACNPQKSSSFLFSGDYSYGMFLYGFPLQQALIVVAPGLAWYMNGIAGVGLAFGAAYASWWLIEKPALGLKPRLLAFEERQLQRAAHSAATARA